MHWQVLYTKPNFEISSANNLNSIGIEAYCPTYTQLKIYSDRKKKVTKPLLRSYIFVKVDQKNRNNVFNIPGILRFLFWLGKPAVVRDNEIELMKNNLSGIYDNILIKKLEIGSKYNIDNGPFKGQVGEVVQMSKNHIKLELASLGVKVFLRAA